MKRCRSCLAVMELLMENQTIQSDVNNWPQRPQAFPELMMPMEAAMYLRLDQTGHNPKSAIRTLTYWRNQGELKATKYGKRVWYLKEQLEAFLKSKTEP